MTVCVKYQLIFHVYAYIMSNPIFHNYNNDFDFVVQIITRLYIIINAEKLGWNVEVYNDKLVLTKHTTKLTRLDKNTPRLIKALFRDVYE